MNNPYACPRGDRPPAPALNAAYVLFYTLGAFWLLAAAARQYLSAVLDPFGLLAGLLLAMIATVVGRTVGTQRGARALTVAGAALLLLGLLRGWIDHAGEERTMWGFACMSSGLLLGAAYPFGPEADDGEEVEEARLVTSDDESIRLTDDRLS